MSRIPTGSLLVATINCWVPTSNVAGTPLRIAVSADFQNSSGFTL